METSNSSMTRDLLGISALYREFQAEREEILRHKWIESQKAGHDIGFEFALTDWIVKHRTKWRTERKKQIFLEQIQQNGVNIAVFSDPVEFRYDRSLIPTKYESKQGLAGIAGIYEYSPLFTLRRASTPLTSPILGGIFANEYQEGNQNYRIHFHEGLELKITRDEKGELQIDQ